MLKHIPLSQITRNPEQPRQEFDEASLRDLAASIELNGLLQPITVRRVDEGYMIVMGERRYRAHLLLLAQDQEQGRKKERTILCNVKAIDEATMHIEAIIENLQRVDVTAMEEARSYNQAMMKLNLTPEELAERLGIKQVWRVSERLELLKLTDDNQALVEKGIIPVGCALHMGCLNPNQQTEFLQVVKASPRMNPQLARTTAQAILNRDSQVPMFGDDEAPEIETSETVSRIERAVTAASKAVVSCYDSDNKLDIAGRVDPNNANTLADECALLRKDLLRIERELRESALRSSIAEAV